MQICGFLIVITTTDDLLSSAVKQDRLKIIISSKESRNLERVESHMLELRSVRALDISKLPILLDNSLVNQVPYLSGSS